MAPGCIGATFCWDTLGPGIYVDVGLTRTTFLNIVKDQVHPPFMVKVFPYDSGLFQQDNVHYHTAHIIQEWFVKHDEEFKVLSWLLNSPDLNPIEDLWDVLKQKVLSLAGPPCNLLDLKDLSARYGRAPTRSCRVHALAASKRPGDACAPEQFLCLSDRACIPASYQCDEEPDCADRSDEYGCAPPTVTSPPEESVTAVRGQTVNFTCTAVGVPTPIITWRLKWGHIPVSSRISMTSENGQGTLTIRNVKEGDQGAYTCEAINAKGLVFAIPDGVLTLSHVPSFESCKTTTPSPITTTITTVAVLSSKSWSGVPLWYDIVRWTLFTIMMVTPGLVHVCTRARASG
ncbi:hemicentin-2-like [Colossoma macropomum]|uniref:hemicentin-2-like n=1 Tax=Colossoma macropomum TaxID=42526 RepID=UPI001864A7CE|nr:hemicentin-2-like [Colossoma macropomum]